MIGGEPSLILLSLVCHRILAVVFVQTACPAPLSSRLHTRSGRETEQEAGDALRWTHHLNGIC